MILFKKFNRLLCNDSITVLNIGTDVTFLNFMQAEEIKAFHFIGSLIHNN